MTSEEFSIFYKQFEALLFSISEENGYTINYFNKALIDFYNNENQLMLKSKIEDIYFTNIYILLINFFSAMKDVSIIDMNSSSYNIKKEKIFDLLQSEKLTKKILIKMNKDEKSKLKQEGIQIMKRNNINIEEAFQNYRKFAEKRLNKYLIEYNIIIIGKFLFDKKKINKNDIIDSQIFLESEKGYSFLTADSDLIKIIENIDSDKAEIIKNEISKWKTI